ncbi:MAG TPA: amino acid permease [Bacteroidia bacterium]|nr:amino acid permease [Bacteroidia bacterium]
MEEKREFRRSLGLIDATALVAGSMIGSGIFIVSSTMAQDLGCAGWLIVAWIMTGVITLTAALSYGELAGMMPEAGGQYVYIRRAWGELPAFLYGWTVFSVIQTGVIAAVATAFANYTSELVPALSMKNVLLDAGFIKISSGQVFAVAMIFFLSWINSRGVQGGALVQKVFTSAKLIALFGLIILGISIGLKSGNLAHNFTDPWMATRIRVSDSGSYSLTPLTGFALLAVFGMTMINSLFSADAWNNVTFIAGEIREPHKNIPRSLLLGTAIVTGLYVLANIAYLALLPLKGDPGGTDVMSRGMQFAEMGRVGTAAATMIFGKIATIMMAVLIMVSTFGCNNGIILAGGRLYYAMAKDGLFFDRIAKLNRKNVPASAIWIQAVWGSLLCFSGTYNDLLTYATFASMLFYIVTISGLFRLRKIEPGTPRPYKALGYPLLPAFYILAAAGICIDLLIMDPRNSWAGLGIVALGIPVFFIRKAFPSQKTAV